ncbi:hypothetical protein [Fretibacter rubidus]|uniref:hypothetical protein n=1 Tax=Fretibacter rubidus TaxID=570162 RepID=UPI00352B8F7A
MRWAVVIVLAMAATLAADMYYETQIVPEAAIDKCGQGNVSAVSLKGLFKADITCK